MNLRNPGAEIFFPDPALSGEALESTTHLAIGAHQDDIEIMAFHGIVECYNTQPHGFTGITCSDGAGSPRRGAFAKLSDLEMQALRKTEQRQAAILGRYAAMIQLDYTTAASEDYRRSGLLEDLALILDSARPRKVYLHNPADKHPTHVACALAAIEALRALPPEGQPEKVYGCEVWRDLDWMPDEAKVALDVSGHTQLAEALLSVFDSQISGGKRYDLAVTGRRRANAVFHHSHLTDQAEELCFAMDLTPLIKAPAADPAAYVGAWIDRFKADVIGKLSRQIA